MPLIDNKTLEKGFRLGDWEVLPLRGVVRRDDESVRLEPGVMAVLLALARRDGDLITRDELVDEVWNGRPTADGPIDRRIAALRKTFGDQTEPREYIETLTKRGYRLLKPVTLPALEDTPDPVEPTPGSRPQVPPNQNGLRWLAGIAAAVLVIVVFWPVNKPDNESIAVLPFVNFTQNPDDNYLVLGFKQELVQTLLSIDDLVVKNVRTPADGASGQAMADELEVDFVLTGSIERLGDRLKVRFAVESGKDGTTIVAGDVAGPVDELFDLQESLAQLVQHQLYPDLPQELLARIRPASADAYNEFMLGFYAFDRRGQPGNIEEAIERFSRTIELDPDYGPAYLQLATAYALMPDYRGADLEASNELALETVNEGISRDPGVSDAAGAVEGFVFQKQKDWLRSEAAYERAVNSRAVDVNAFNWYSRMLASVGRLGASLDMAKRGLELDPGSAVLNSRVAMAYTWLGLDENAQVFFERANELGASGATHLLAYALLLSRMGETDRAYEVARQGIDMSGLDGAWVDPVFAGLTDPALAPQALAAVSEASRDGQITPQIEVVVRTLLGDLEAALLIAGRLEEPGEIFEMDLLYTPELEPLRLDPGFPLLMQRLGVEAYWQAVGCLLADGVVRCEV